MCRPSCFNVFEQAYFKDILCVLHSPGIFHVLYTMLKRSRLMISINLIHVCLSILTVPVSHFQPAAGFTASQLFACRMNYRFPRYFSSSPSFSSSSTHCTQCLLLVIIIIIIIILLSSLLLNALVSPTQTKSRVSYHLTIINTGHCYVTLAAHLFRIPNVFKLARVNYKLQTARFHRGSTKCY